MTTKNGESLDGYTIKVSTDQTNWTNYQTSGYSVENNNTTVWAKITDGTNESGTASGKIVNIDKDPPIVSSKVDYSKTTSTEKNIPTPSGGTLYIDSNGKKVPIPKGFEYLTGTVDTGLVIKNLSEESEFVWVPVPYVVAKSLEEVEEVVKGSATITLTVGDGEGSGIDSVEVSPNTTIKKINNTIYTVDITEEGVYTFTVTDKVGWSTVHQVEVKETTYKTGNHALVMDSTGSVTENAVGILYNYDNNGISGVAGLADGSTEVSTLTLNGSSFRTQTPNKFPPNGFYTDWFLGDAHEVWSENYGTRWIDALNNMNIFGRILCW